MKTKLLCPLLGILSLQAALAAAPTLTITAPRANANLTAGTAKSPLGIKAVYYSLNGSAFEPATGTTNWAAANLALTAGPNSLSAYAVDNSNNLSHTNKVTFSRVVFLPLEVSLSPSNSWGSTSLTNGTFTLK